MSQEIDVVIVPWYREEDYGRLLWAFDDTHLFPVRFQEWLVLAECQAAQIRADGAVPINAPIDVETFFIWCCAKRIRADRHARLKFARILSGLYEIRELRDPDQPRPVIGSRVAVSREEGRR